MDSFLLNIAIIIIKWQTFELKILATRKSDLALAKNDSIGSRKNIILEKLQITIMQLMWNNHNYHAENFSLL